MVGVKRVTFINAPLVDVLTARLFNIITLSRPHNNDKKRSHKTFANSSVADAAVDFTETTSLLRSIHGMLLKHETNAQSTSETNPSKRNSQGNLYGMPALNQLPQDVKISNLDLGNKNILWYPISSAGVSLPLPLDTCCSVSLVSQQYADRRFKFTLTFSFRVLSSPLQFRWPVRQSHLKL